jgi:hypothetical protein
MLQTEYFREAEYASSRIFRDTTIYKITNKLLELSFTGRSFKQISGQKRQLSFGSYYDVAPARLGYTHDMFYFTSDSIHHYSTLSEVTQMPNQWLSYSEHKYSSSNSYIDIKHGHEEIRWSYVFYRSDLILASSPILFEKITK